jgi:hypothetical protein
MILQLRSSTQSHDIDLGHIDHIHFDGANLMVHNPKTRTWTDVLTVKIDHSHTIHRGLYLKEPGEQIEYDTFSLVIDT